MKNYPASVASVLILAATSLPSAAAPAQKYPPVAPQYCAKPEYPKEALRYELEGKTTLRYTISPEGRMVDVTVTKSSGWRLLDDATVAFASSCAFPPEQIAAFQGKTYPLQYVWSLDRHEAHPALVTDSCQASQTFAGLKLFDDQSSDERGLKIRFLVDAAGQPYGVKSEGGSLDTATADQLAAYVQSCRFVFDPKVVPKPSTDAMFGRVLMR
ncbi:energy transducer TonB [Massilia pinisoli]|uniref:Energy transducer TonB n=1 Tax=Massilia pinisoli TaxID=1772194 RepID=A0ABT1ZV84_9BURK|nr:energy transducer TonB [Massilia pinisoli]MCS0583858.1 energy transducer TonB [Massilia pinisoli]